MNKLVGAFDTFRNAIEPEYKKKEHAQKADDPVREHLASHESFAAHHVDTFLYGSYKRQTAVGDIKDVDLVVVTNFKTYDDPLKVLETLKDSLAELYKNPQLSDQRRSIRVDKPLPNIPSSKLTLDVIPAIFQNPAAPDGPLWVPDRNLRRWIPSHPKGHLAATSKLSAESKLDYGYVRLTKMIKWWWQYQSKKRKPSVASHERKPKGFWIEVMTGKYADLNADSYAELVTTLFARVLHAFRVDRQRGWVTSLPDPGLAQYSDPNFRAIKTSMTLSEFSFFIDVMEESYKWAQEANAADSESTASEYWRKVFGPEFPLVSGEASKGLLSPAATPASLSFPNYPVQPKKPGGFA